MKEQSPSAVVSRFKPEMPKSVSGAGMDRKVASKNKLTKGNMTAALIGIVLIVFVYFLLQQNGERSLSVKQTQILQGTVTMGVFEDVVPVRGRIEPDKTVFLDAIEGGRVERVWVEAGNTVKAGDLLIELSNPSLQLDVLGNEARVAEQLNSMRTMELRLEQNRLTHKRNLADVEYQISMHQRQVERELSLVKQGAVAESTLKDTQDTLAWYKHQQTLILESQKSDAQMQETQLAFLRDTSQRLEQNLAISRQNLDNMNVRAPVDGVLSGFDLQIGQSIGQGERIGQVDTPDDFKLTAHINEFYLARISIGQLAKYKNHTLEIRKIFPNVQNGLFRVDFAFIDQQPTALRRGQSIQTQLMLGDASEALLIPNGSFFQETGGNWVFVVAPDGNTANKRNVRLGRRNAKYIEVLEGLSEGETVLLSSYSSYLDVDSLQLQ